MIKLLAGRAARGQGSTVALRRWRQQVGGSTELSSTAAFAAYREHRDVTLQLPERAHGMVHVLAQHSRRR